MSTTQKTRLISVCLIFYVLAMHSQNQTNKWYFGFQAGLNFMTSPPTPLAGSAMNAAEAASSISDAAGNLLFYTEGTTVYNQNNVVMANGSGLLGNYSTTQGLIVKQPGNTNIYYIFTLDQLGYPNGFRYSIVDMSLAAGLGSVTTMNNLLYTPSCEKIAATIHCNGVDVWVVTHDYNSDQFRSILLTATGLSTPVVSSAGPTVGGSVVYSTGEMKISPNGEKLALAIRSKSYELYDFDKSSGVVSNGIVLASFTGSIQPYGCEFSPDSRVLYGGADSGMGLHRLYQWNLCSGTSSAIISSQLTIATPTVGLYALQLASNGKIYIARQGNFLSVIDSPNNLGSSCNFLFAGQAVFGNCVLGLPNFVSSFFAQAPLGPSQFSYSFNPLISCLSVSFNYATQQYCGSSMTYSWNFDDPISGQANTSAVSNPVHLFSGPGTYTVQLFLIKPCKTDTINQIINITMPGPISVSGNYTLCSGKNTTITASGANTYSWNNVPSSPTIVLSPSTTTTYSVLGTTSLSPCPALQTSTIYVIPSPTLTVASNLTVCPRQAVTLTVSGANSYQWNSSSTGSLTVITPINNTVVSVTGINTNSCSSSRSVTITVRNCTEIANIDDRGNQFRFYPNPGTQIFYCEVEDEFEITIYNSTGQTIYKAFLTNGKHIIDLSEAENGIYFVKANNGKFLTHIKFLKL